ncbi:phage holin family protein [Phytoactinopolyspora mesophila]|uniref:Phage holin family protein n=1 Tax=Phytoactinopolyspora mesophila TaxID=2650750 RepID=A0A7K3MAW5_9ACTN|nr:phage holin family protein [Phytoactinopolyspora mesophila]NDL60451.1 phage holin family protein [Phytoactinopolyspora mesophila]
MTTRSADAAPAVSTGQLIGEIKDDLSGLVKDEIELAKAEIREDAKAVGLGGALLAVVALLALLALVMLSIALAFGIHALGLGLGWAFLITAGAQLLLAAILGLVAKNRFGSVSGPKRAQRAAKQAIRPVQAGSTS